MKTHIKIAVISVLAFLCIEQSSEASVPNLLDYAYHLITDHYHKIPSMEAVLWGAIMAALWLFLVAVMWFINAIK